MPISRAAVWLAALAGAWLASCGPRYLPQLVRAELLERSVTVDDETYRFRVFLPRHYDRRQTWPVILFLHGSGERGDDDVAQATVGLGALLVRRPHRVPAIVVLPQCRAGEEWLGAMGRQALAALDQTVAEFHGDPSRLYLTGLSMGGSGAWYLARNRRFAAAVPVCGEIEREEGDPLPEDAPAEWKSLVAGPDPFATLAREIGPLPVWAFHGALDDQIPVAQSRGMVAALRRVSPEVRYTEYPDIGHASWDRAYDTPGLWSWLLDQRLAVRPDTPGGWTQGEPLRNQMP